MHARAVTVSHDRRSPKVLVANNAIGAVVENRGILLAVCHICHDAIGMCAVSCPPACVYMRHVQYKLQPCVRKELPVERRNDHFAESWKYLNVKATIISLLFPYFCCRNFRLDLRSGEIQSIQPCL